MHCLATCNFWRSADGSPCERHRGIRHHLCDFSIGRYRGWRPKRKIKKQWRKEGEYEPEPILGDAAFADDLEISAAHLFTKTGIPCGYSTRGVPIKYFGTGMVATIAPVGSMKGAALIVPAALGLDDRSLIIIEPKGEAGAVTSAHRSTLGPCYVVAPYGGRFEQTKGIVARRNHMDILNCPENERGPNARMLAESIVFRETASAEGEFFSDAAINLVHAVILGVHELSDDKTLNRVVQIISTNEIFDWARMVCVTTKDEFLKQHLGMFATGKEDDRTLTAILQTARTSLSFLSDISMKEYGAESNFDYADARKQVSTYYITVPVHRQDVADRFFFMELNMMLNRLLIPGKGNTRVTVICDDFATYGAPPAIERAMGVARAFGVQIWTVLQDLSQIESKYPYSWETFLANAAVRHFMTPQDQKTAAYVSEQLGVVSVSQWQKSLSTDNQTGKPVAAWGHQPHLRPLMHPHEVRAMPEGDMLVWVRGLSNAIYARRIPYWLRPEFRGKFKPNPYY